MLTPQPTPTNYQEKVQPEHIMQAQELAYELIAKYTEQEINDMFSVIRDIIVDKRKEDVMALTERAKYIESTLNFFL